MNKALWQKSISEALRLLAASLLLMFVFHWLRVWITSQVSLAELRMFLRALPAFLRQLSPVPIEQIATSVGRIAVSYDDPIVLLLVTVWAIARGSDAVSGEIGRGTMELVLAQPVRRLTVLWTQATVTTVGAGLLAASAWLGTATGLATVQLEEPVQAQIFVPAAINLFGLTFFLAGLTTLVSSPDRNRWRTISLVGGIYIVEMIFKVVGMTAIGWRWLNYLTFFTLFEPEPLALDAQKAWSWRVAVPNGGMELAGLGFDALLLGMGLACYGLATVIFCRRDLPAPL
jgi:ABC-2 type transport system permease protein